MDFYLAVILKQGAHVLCKTTWVWNRNTGAEHICSGLDSSNPLILGNLLSVAGLHCALFLRDGIILFSF